LLLNRGAGGYNRLTEGFHEKEPGTGESFRVYFFYANPVSWILLVEKNHTITLFPSTKQPSQQSKTCLTAPLVKAHSVCKDLVENIISC